MIQMGDTFSEQIMSIIKLASLGPIPDVKLSSFTSPTPMKQPLIKHVAERASLAN